MYTLEIKSLTKKYSNCANDFNALKNVSFSIDEGEFVAITGVSGSGKSTLLHIIGGIDKPTCGKVLIKGQDISLLSENDMAIFRRKNIGIIYQFFNLISTLSAEENIALPLLLDRKKVNKKQLDEIIKTLNLEDKRRLMPSQLSGGEQQKVSIARAIINNPTIVLADEPTGNLDINSTEELINIFKYYNKIHNQTLLLITHDENIASQANRIIRIRDGKILSNEKNE